MGRTLRTLLLGLALIAALGSGLVAGLLAWPAPLFPHELREGRIVLRSDRPIPEAARAVLREVDARLRASSFETGAASLGLYTANTPWRRRIIWSVATPLAGGFVVVPFSRDHAFLNRTDFGTGLLTIPGFGTIDPPRTIAYYGAHELTHVLTARAVGTLRYHRMPHWVREGIADYVAMRPVEPFDELADVLTAEPIVLWMRRQYGWYADDRLLVRYFLDIEGWSLERLLATDMPRAEAWDRMLAYRARTD